MSFPHEVDRFILTLVCVPDSSDDAAEVGTKALICFTVVLYQKALALEFIPFYKLFCGRTVLDTR